MKVKVTFFLNKFWMAESAIFTCNINLLFFLNLTSINNRKLSQFLTYFYPILTENFMTKCEIANDMCEFENGKLDFNTNLYGCL